MTIIYKIMLLCLVFEGKEKRWHVFGEGKYLVFLVGKNEKGRGTFSEKRIILEDVEDLEKNLRIIGNEKQEYFGEGIYLDPRGKEGTRMKLNIFFQKCTCFVSKCLKNRICLTKLFLI